MLSVHLLSVVRVCEAMCAYGTLRGDPFAALHISSIDWQAHTSCILSVVSCLCCSVGARGAMTGPVCRSFHAMCCVVLSCCALIRMLRVAFCLQAQVSTGALLRLLRDHQMCVWRILSACSSVGNLHSFRRPSVQCQARQSDHRTAQDKCIL